MVSSHIERVRRVLEIEIGELQRLMDRLDGSVTQAVAAMLETVCAGHKIVVVGVGKSGHVGEKLAATLTSTGSPALFLNVVNALHGDLGILADGDLIIALSSSGETAELLNLLPALRRFEIRLLSLTGEPASTLARHSDLVLDCSVAQEACPLNLAPTSSTTVMLALGDALAMALLEARGFQRQDFARYHPGGRLGRVLLQKVTDVMRDETRLPKVAPETPVLAVLHAMNNCRAGLAVVVDPQGKLIGIFTHGDFVRAFEREPAMVDQPVSRYMGQQPITIAADKLAVEMLHVLEHHRIDDLVVVNQENEPVGIIDSQDLTKFKLL